MRPSQQYENAPATDRWLNRRQAAEHVGLSSRTLDRLALDGSGPPFAVVGKRHFDGDRPDGVRYGVIDEHGKTVIAPDYDGIELVTQGALTLAFLRTEYDAWWRFWEWNWHFSLLGSSPPIT